MLLKMLLHQYCLFAHFKWYCKVILMYMCVFSLKVNTLNLLLDRV